MLGYIVPLKAELKIREFEAYLGYYCGICKSIKKRYGNLPRLTLSFDSVFLALMLAGTKNSKENLSVERCIANPLKKRNIVIGEAAIDYAADMMLILAFYKFNDDIADEKSLKGLMGKTVLRGPLKELLQKRSEKCKVVESKIEELFVLEKENCNSVDPAAEPFAKLMEEIFDSDEFVLNDRLLYRKFGYHLGKWIFLIDAYDDIEKDILENGYNPLVKQHGYKVVQDETVSEFKDRIRSRTELNLHLYLTEMAKVYEEMKIVKNKGLIENIIYFGLYKKTEEVLANIESEQKAKENSKQCKTHMKF